MEGCGGPSDVFLLTHGGDLVPIDSLYIDTAEHHLMGYDSITSHLLLTASDLAMDDAEFQKHADIMVKHVQFMRSIWRANSRVCQDFTTDFENAIKYVRSTKKTK